MYNLPNLINQSKKNIKKEGGIFMIKNLFNLSNIASCKFYFSFAFSMMMRVVAR